MKAVQIHSHGGPEVLKWEEIPDKYCPDDKVRVKMKAAALNHLDIWVREGLPGLDLPLPMILGSDGSGKIIEVGNSVRSWEIGDEIVIQPNIYCGHCRFCKSGMENYCNEYGIIGETENGTQATEIIISPQNIYRKPSHLTFEEAASMQLVFLTAYQMLVKRAKLREGENLLVYGGTSGIGSAAIQIGKYLGARVIATVGDSAKFTHAEKMGADYIFNHNDNIWSSSVKSIVSTQGVNVVFEHVGPATWQSSVRLLGRGGRIVTCGATSGPKVEIDLRHLFMKQQSILGSTMSDISSFREVMTLIEEKIFFPFIDVVFPFHKVADAHRRLENRIQYGKIVLNGY